MSGVVQPALAARAAWLTVSAAIAAQARQRPRAIAVEWGDLRRTYAELAERAYRLANALWALGVRRGDRVAILSENRPEYVELEMAAGWIGAIVACQNWRLAERELDHCLALVEPRVLFVSERFAAVTKRLAHRVPQEIVLDDPYERLLASAPAAPPPGADAVDVEDGLLILYTSGTTGLPKGALISHRAMVARCLIQALDRRSDPDAAFIAWTPLFHMGSTDVTLATLMRGAKVIIVDGFDAASLVDRIAQEKLSHLSVVPGVIDRLIDALRGARTMPRGVGTVGVMADLVPPHQIATLTSLLNAPYCNTFGSTETGSPPASRSLIPVGVAPTRLSKEQSSGCTIRLVDEHDADVPDGQPGELAMRGPSLFSGYWNAPEANAEAFRDGWYHMGDVFVRNADGTLDFVDRRKYLIKSGGENIYPSEIERVLLAMPQVADAVVVRRPDARWGEVPVAFVVPNDPVLSVEAVLAECRGHIAGYKLPKEVRFVQAGALPRSLTGKVVRHELEQRLLSERQSPA